MRLELNNILHSMATIIPPLSYCASLAFIWGGVKTSIVSALGEIIQMATDHVFPALRLI